MRRKIVNPVIKDTATFIQTAAETGGKVSEIEFTLLPGGGNVPHYHKTYAETFTAVDGKLGLKSGKNKTIILEPGQSYTVQPMEIHHFFNPEDREIKFKVEFSPGHEGMENSLRIIYGLASDGLTDKKSIPKSLKHTAIILNMSDMNAPGLLTLLAPVLKLIANRAKREEAMLIARYCN